jgi:hypothetical protein
MFISDLFENVSPTKQIVIMSGGFHPFHPGHYSLYQAARKAFPHADVWVAATNDTKTRPFPFEYKQELASIAGVPPEKFIQVKSPFNPVEIVSQYDPSTTSLIFVRSTKDEGGLKVGGVKKDGSPAYLQPYHQDHIEPMAKHGYMAYLPTIEFKVGSNGVSSATEIRNLWVNSNDQERMALAADLYPRAANNQAVLQKVVSIMNSALVDHG